MNLFYNACKVILPLTLILGILLVLGNGPKAQETSSEGSPNEATSYISVEELADLQMDFDLEDEVQQRDAVLQTFTPKDPNGYYVYADPQEVAAPYIPEDALCTEVCIIGNVVSFDYRLNNIRYIASYCLDGTVRLTTSVYADPVDYVYEITSDDPHTVMRLDCRDNTVTLDSETAQ